jgi:hypothetical protein
MGPFGGPPSVPALDANHCPTTRGNEEDQSGEEVAQRLLSRDFFDHSGQHAADQELLKGDDSQVSVPGNTAR